MSSVFVDEVSKVPPPVDGRDLNIGHGVKLKKEIENLLGGGREKDDRSNLGRGVRQRWGSGTPGLETGRR